MTVTDQQRRMHPSHSIIDTPDVHDLALEAELAGLLEPDGSFSLTPAGRALFEDPEGGESK